LEGGDPKYHKSNTDKFQCRWSLQPFNLNIPEADARKAGVGSKFYPAYSDDVAKKKNSTALSVKASNAINVENETVVKVLAFSDDISTVEEGDNQDPTTPNPVTS